MNLKLIRTLALAGVGVALIATSGCAPAPRFEMGSEAKLSDMWWFISKYEENYAPLNYKEERFGLKWDQLKQKYIAEAQATKTNEEFYKVAYKFVAEFKDAHNSASITTSGLPARAKIAYLGFTGKRQGEKLRVTEFLPTSQADGFPVKAGDLIKKLNGVTLAEAVKSEMTLYRNLGHDEANLTYHMPKLFTRISNVNGQPEGELATLTIERGGEEVEVLLPWVVQDVYVFNQEQQKAAGKKAEQVSDPSMASLMATFKMGYINFFGKLDDSHTMLEKITRYLPSFKWHNTFRFVDDMPVWMVELNKALADGAQPQAVSARETLAKERDIPDGARMVETSTAFPAYTVMQPMTTAEGKEVGKKLLTYMRLNTFSPSGGEDLVVAEMKALLKTMRDSGSNDLVIDMIDNGGGSVSLGLRLAQALSNTRVAMPEIQFRLSNSWADNFEQESLMAKTATERTLSGKVLGKLLEDRAAGKRLSRRMPVETLLNWPEGPNKDIKEKLNIVLLVNEMCASMCDIFTATLKDNGLAKVVGSRSMGAGGNVVNYAAAPNSNMQIRQTESLILRADGSYVENNGVAPDVEMAVNEDEAAKYAAVRAKAFSILTAVAAPAAAPATQPVAPAVPAVPTAPATM